MIYYIYTDERGKPLFRVIREEPKRFWVEKLNESGEWTKGLEGVRIVPYKLDELIKEPDIVFVVEGEKDVETLRGIGFRATTNPFGAGKWSREFNPFFKGKRVILLPDNDEVGRRHMEEVASNIYAFAKEVKVIPLPGLKEKEDVTDWFNYGHSEEELMDLVEESQYIWFPKRNLERKEREISIAGEKRREEEEISRKEKFPLFPREAWVSIFADYLRLISSCTEAPDSFHFASIVSILGLFLGRKFYLRHPHPVYQNYYFILVGTTALTHKGTALRFGEELADWLKEEIKFMHVFVSAEGIFNVLAKEAGTRLLVVNDEMRTLFANAQRSGTLNVFANLCTLYDLKKNVVVGQKKNLTIEEGLLGMISAVTPEWLSETVEVEAAIGGFLNRNIIVAGEPKGPIANPLPPAEDEKIKFIKEIKDWRESLDKDGGEIKKSARGMAFYKEYYDKWHKEVFKESRIIQNLRARESLHVLKLAGMFALVNNRMEILPEDIERGISVINHSRRCQEIIFKDIELSRMGVIEQRVLETLESGPKTKREICRKISSYFTYGEKAKAIKNLQEAGIIEVEHIKNKRGKMSEYCCLSDSDEV